MWASVSLDTFQVADQDGDGTAEVFIATYMHEEGYAETVPFLLRLLGDRVEPYPTNPVSPAWVKDIDGDGRFDLLSPASYGDLRYRTALADASLIPVVMFAAHAQPDGSFSPTSPAAIRWLKSTCPGPGVIPEAAVDPTDFSTLGAAVACARAWGTSPAAVRRQLSQLCTSFVDYPLEDGQCPVQILEVADRRPPVRLSP
jgi:hypothetical protein